MHHWNDESAWNIECAHSAGFLKSNSNDYITYNEFKTITLKMSNKITMIMSKCLNTDDFMQIKNALIVLKRLISYFPHNKECAEKIEKLLDKLTSNAQLSQDLHMMVGRYRDELHKKKTSLPNEESKSKKAEEDKKEEKKKDEPKKTKPDEKVYTKKHGASPHDDYRRAKKKKEEENPDEKEHNKSKDSSQEFKQHSHKSK
jgi:Transcription factor/nuclear export subunit protein 2